MKSKSKLKVAIVAAFALITAGGVAAYATTSAEGDYTSNGVNIRTTGNTSATSVGLGYIGDGITATCVATRGSSVSGNTEWVRHKNKDTNKKGYSSETLVSFSGTVPSSGSNTCTPAP